MAEFGLRLPPLPTATKLGVDGKGEKAFIIAQSKVAVVLGVVFVLSMISGCMYITNSSNKEQYTSNIEVAHVIEEHQRLSKLEAQEKIAHMSAKMNQQAQTAKEEESDLRIMSSHIAYVHQRTHQKIMNEIDNESLKVADIKQQVEKYFSNMQGEISSILHDHLVVVEGANTKSHAEMDRIEAELQEMMLAQQAYDSKQDDFDASSKSGKSAASESEANKLIEARINDIFSHVHDLAEKMGETDTDSLLSPGTVKEWEQVLADAETGKLAYPDAIAKMEQIIERAPAALKLAEATGALELIEEDGGAKGVTEVTNFRSLLKHIRWLPQYAAVLEEYKAWDKGERTVQEVLMWTEGKLAKNEIDGEWLHAVYSKAHTETTPKTRAEPQANSSSTTSGSASPASAASVTAKATATARVSAVAGFAGASGGAAAASTSAIASTS
jgi:hypothetical protein